MSIVCYCFNVNDKMSSAKRYPQDRIIPRLHRSRAPLCHSKRSRYIFLARSSLLGCSSRVLPGSCNPPLDQDSSLCLGSTSLPLWSRLPDHSSQHLDRNSPSSKLTFCCYGKCGRLSATADPH